MEGGGVLVVLCAVRCFLLLSELMALVVSSVVVICVITIAEA